MAIQFQGSGGFNEKFFDQRFAGESAHSRKGQKLADGKTVAGMLDDKRLTQAEYKSLRADYTAKASQAGLSADEALVQFNSFLADSLDGRLEHAASQASIDVITDLGFVFDEEAAVALRSDDAGALSLESGRIDATGFHAGSFGELVAGEANAADRQAALEKLWREGIGSIGGNVFRAADNTKGRYISPETLIQRHQAEAGKQKKQIVELKAVLYMLTGQPGAEQPPLSDKIARYQTLHDLLSLNQRVHEAFAANPKRWAAHNLDVDTKALGKLNQLLGELELFKVRIDASPNGAELKRQWKDLRNSVQAVTLALGNHQYTSMCNKQPMDLHVTATAQRYEIHKLDVRQKERRDVDASPTGFVKAKILEGEYDHAYALKLSQALDGLDKVPAGEFDARARQVRAEIAHMLRDSIIGQDGYRESILDMVDARVLSRGVQLRLPAYQQRYEALSREHDRLLGKPDPKARQPKRDLPLRRDLDNTAVARPVALPTWQRPRAHDALVDGINVHDKTIAGLRQDLIPETAALKESERKAEASDAYVKASGTGGSAVGQLLTGKNADTRASNATVGKQLGQLEQKASSLATQSAGLEASLWKGKLSRADETYLRRIFEAASEAKEGSPLHQLGQCYKAMGLYQEGGKWKHNIDLGKLNAKVAQLSQDPGVQKTFAAIKQDVAKQFYSAKEVTQLSTHLRSPEFREYLFSLPKEKQQQELAENLQVLAFADPKQAEAISAELANAYLLERPEQLLDQLTPFERRSAFELALDKLGDTGAVIARGGVGLRTARDMMVLSAVGKAKIAEALAAIPAKELRTCFDHVDLMKLLNKQLLSMGTDVTSIAGDLSIINKLSKSGRMTGFGLAATAAVGHIGEGLVTGELVGAIQAYGAKVAQSVGGIFAKGTDVAKLAETGKDLAELGDAGKDLAKVANASDEIGDLAKLGGHGLKGIKGFKWPSWIGKAGGQVGKVAKYLGPVGEAWGIYSDSKGMIKDFGQGDAFGGSMKGIQAGAGITGLGTGILVAAGCAGPGAPVVIAGALVIGIGAWVLDSCFGKSDEQSLLENLGVYKD